MDQRVPFPPAPNAPYRSSDYRWAADGLGWLHGLFSLLIVLAIIAGAVYLVRLFLSRPTPRWGTPKRNAAVDELDLRYARGEVDRTDYLQRRSDLLDGSLRAAPAAMPPPREPGVPG